MQPGSPSRVPCDLSTDGSEESITTHTRSRLAILNWVMGFVKAQMKGPKKYDKVGQSRTYWEWTTLAMAKEPAAGILVVAPSVGADAHSMLQCNA